MLRVLAFLGILFLSAFCYALFPSRRLPLHIVGDQLVVYKRKRKLQLWSKGKRIKTYTIALGQKPTGAKEIEGDMRTPQGVYTIHSRNPESAFYLNLGISYPNEKDKAYANELGHSAGGAIKIHGLRNGSGWKGRFHRLNDWTAGCIAVTNAEMKELYRAVPLGTPIIIHP
ncbi:L,D-transpeptidase family protein [Catalinimonas niigatensis]|uniref:L,D-transpeptidase family protein n=1 Tax=Catalinimonas niigatensis TaxID=1397264 RepID=UPI0026652D10|nr:L,D-transpeptidase family protein [Catalinimonas niigatensis]WPP49099.1 L,D-transpeptidase family protein [Catalinimonas niigatensis]